MMTLGKKLGLAALLAFGTSLSAQAMVLDTFEYDVALVADGSGSSDTATFTSVTETTPAGDVTYTLSVVSDTSPFDSVTVNASIAAGALYYSEGSNVDSQLTLNYFDLDATSPIDITDAGDSVAFYFDVIFADSGFETLVTVTDFFGGSSTGTLTTAATATDETLYLLFSDFVGTANFSMVTKIDAVINSPISSDLILAEVGTVPEPTTIAVFGLGLIGFAFSRKRAK